MIRPVNVASYTGRGWSKLVWLPTAVAVRMPDFVAIGGEMTRSSSTVGSSAPLASQAQRAEEAAVAAAIAIQERLRLSPEEDFEAAPESRRFTLRVAEFRFRVICIARPASGYGAPGCLSFDEYFNERWLTECHLVRWD